MFSVKAKEKKKRIYTDSHKSIIYREKFNHFIIVKKTALDDKVMITSFLLYALNIFYIIYFFFFLQRLNVFVKLKYLLSCTLN